MEIMESDENNFSEKPEESDDDIQSVYIHENDQPKTTKIRPLITDLSSHQSNRKSSVVDIHSSSKKNTKKSYPVIKSEEENEKWLIDSSSKPPQKRERIDYTNTKKAEIINSFFILLAKNTNLSIASYAKDVGVEKYLISRWIKDKDNINERALGEIFKGEGRNFTKKSDNLDLEDTNYVINDIDESKLSQENLDINPIKTEELGKALKYSLGRL